MKKFRFAFVIIALFAALCACDNNSPPNSEEKSYSIRVHETVSDWVSVNKTSAKKDETVTATANPPFGKTPYLTVHAIPDASHETNFYYVDITRNNDNTYTFRMPAADVEIHGNLFEASDTIYSMELDERTLKWDAHIRDGETIKVEMKTAGGSRWTSVSLEKDARELDLSTLPYFTDFLGKAVVISVTIVNSYGWSVGSDGYRELLAVITDDSLPTLNTPTDLKVENNTVSWKWVDVNNECGGFVVTVNGQDYDLQYYPYFKLDVGFTDKTYEISVYAQGVTGKSNASQEAKITYEYKVPVYEVTFNLNDGSNRTEKIQTVNGKISDYTPERQGYIFNGWYTSNDGGLTLQRRFTDTELVTENLNLYADWVEKESTAGIQRLAKPKVTVLGSLARWQAISGTNGYHVQIINGGEVVYDQTIDSTEIDVADYVYEEGKTVTLKVRARGNGETTANSDYTTVNVKTASLPEDFIKNIYVDYNIGVVYWTLYDEVAYYVTSFTSEVYDKTTGDFVGNYFSNNPEFVLKQDLPAGDYRLKIYLGGISHEVVTTFTNIRLNSPELQVTLTENGFRISWGAVRYADSYTVSVNGTERTIEDTYVDVPFADRLEVTVKAKDSDADYIVSRASALLIEKLGDGEYRLTMPGRKDALLVNREEYTIASGTLKTSRLIFSGKKLTVTGDFSEVPEGAVSSSTVEHLVIENLNRDEKILKIFANTPETLTAVTISSGLERISYAFSGFTTLKKANLGSGIRKLDYPAFWNCIELEELTATDLLIIDNSSFSTGTPIVNYESGIYYLRANGNDHYAVLKADPRYGGSSFSLHEDTKIIASLAFQNLMGLRDLAFPEGLLAIGDGAFAETDIKNAYLPDTLRYLGHDAFYFCDDLVSVRIPESITEIQDRTFGNCFDLVDFHIHDKIRFFGIDNVENLVNQVTLLNGIFYLGTEDNPYFLAFRLDGSSFREIELHEDCVVLGSALFRDCSQLSRLEYSDKVRGFGEYLFESCQELKEISISKGSTIHERAFFNSYLERINFSGTKEEWNEIFQTDFVGCLSTITVYCTDGTIVLDY